MATGAAEMIFQGIFEGSIVMQDSLIERRPYHRNCGCALHKLKGDCSSACSRTGNLSFPKKQTWTDCSLSLSASIFSSQSSLHAADVFSVRSQEDANAAHVTIHTKNTLEAQCS
ncbi:hypothetical protein CCACVL1_29278 [Corchorus capsularis]|uniref:Uncharacterized protein n=1 Tax=Corchorus capsularis TaxID=210143 RepID=A0A1R3G2K4_COCAP|nr:hypothetical protein CCACVL1_29278 [Corchorus capsularis]